MNSVGNIETFRTDESFVKTLMERNSYRAFANNILEGYSLYDFQCVDLLTILANKQALVNYETGMGKTIISSALMKCLHNKDRNNKSIFIMKSIQVLQTPKKITEATGLRCLCVTGENKDIENFICNTMFEHDILIITHSCLNNNAFVDELYKRKHLYNCMIVDEAHELTNFYEAQSAAILRAMWPHFEYRVALTATPITSSIDQFVNIMHMMLREIVPSPYRLTKVLQTGEISAQDLFKGELIIRTRKDLGVVSDYRPYIVKVDPVGDQLNCRGKSMFAITKGPGAYPQAEAVKRIIKGRKDKGLIYVNLNVVREFLFEELQKAGIRVACVYGKTTLKERKEIQKKFENGELDVIITSVTTSLDLECDYIIFYEFTVDIYQMIGRADRGLKNKRLDIFFIITAKTGEADYFLNNIYERSLLIRRVFRMEPNIVEKLRQLL